jgi:WD40 repeat protein
MNLSLLSSVAATDLDERIWHVAWSNNGSFLVTCGEDKVIHIWRIIADSVGNIAISLISTIEDVQARTIRSCEWSPNGKMIASASFDGTVIIWKAQDNSLKFWDQLASLEGHDNEVKSVSWCYDGSYIATCGRDKKVWIWETIVGGEFECVAMLDGHTQDVKFV